MQVRILIVDDDPQIRTLLSEFLERYGFACQTAANGDEMWQVLDDGKIDLVVLDLMLPGDNGFTLCKKLRARTQLPVIMLTARGELADRIVGLELGADDYVVKPFEPRELVARINTILRRTHTEPAAQANPPQKNAQVRFEGWLLNPVTRLLTSPEKLAIPLSNAEFRLLWAFIERPRHVLNRDQLLDAARGRAAEAFDRSIDLLVSRLRQKLQDDPRLPRLLKTVRGEGYLFDAEVCQ